MFDAIFIETSQKIDKKKEKIVVRFSEIKVFGLAKVRIIKCPD
jgi:hypothetical protein